MDGRAIRRRRFDGGPAEDANRRPPAGSESRSAARAWAATSRSCPPPRPAQTRSWRSAPPPGSCLRRGLDDGPLHVRRRPTPPSIDFSPTTTSGPRPKRSRSPCCSSTPRATSRCRWSTRASSRHCSVRQKPADRASPAAITVDPARRRDAGREPAVHRAGARRRHRPAQLAARPASRPGSSPGQAATEAGHETPEPLGHARDGLCRPGAGLFDRAADRRARTPDRAGNRARRLLDDRPDLSPGPREAAAERVRHLLDHLLALLQRGWRQARRRRGVPHPLVAHDDVGVPPASRPEPTCSPARRPCRSRPSARLRPRRSAGPAAAPRPGSSRRAGAADRRHHATPPAAARKPRSGRAGGARRDDDLAGRVLDRDVGPTPERHERAGYDEHKRSHGQQRAGGADAGEICPSGTHQPRISAASAETFSDFHDFSYS